jgi:hypothetical protein
MTHKLDSDDFFIQRVQQRSAELGLNFFLIEPLWVEPFRIYSQLGEVWTRVLLNMHSEHHQPDEEYHRLVRLLHERGTQVIDPPDVALAAFDKARLHHRLVEAGLTVPPTVVVSREQVADFRLTDPQREMLGSPFVIKPSMGYGRRGVVLDATSEQDLARSHAGFPSPHYLMQRKVTPRDLGGEPAYFRVYYAFGSVWCCWWNCFTDQYRLVSDEDLRQHQLQPLRDIVTRIASLTGMKFFSTELAQTPTGEFVAIDYVNDQCHMVTKSSNPKIGVPDQLVAAIAHRLVEGAYEMIQKRC